jgi:hypothetical protein
MIGMVASTAGTMVAATTKREKAAIAVEKRVGRIQDK